METELKPDQPNTDSPIQYLKNEYLRRVKKNQSYSLRAFAQFLGISSGALSEIFNGRRKLTVKMAQKLSKSLGLNHLEAKEFVQRTLDEGHRQFQKKVAGKAISDDLFFVVSEWYCFALLNLTQLHEFQWDPNWIMQKLGINRLQLESALKSLVKIGLLRPKGSGYEPTQEHIFTETNLPSSAIKNYHESILHKAIHAIDNQPIEQREYVGAGMAVSLADIDSIKKEMNEFLDHLIEKYGHGQRLKDRVYHIEMSLFKITQ
jgi:uncharacterized protein (TIGR02147 family)